MGHSFLSKFLPSAFIMRGLVSPGIIRYLLVLSIALGPELFDDPRNQFGSFFDFFFRGAVSQSETQ